MTRSQLREFAPGKLFLAGEYAVVTPAEPALLIAVSRGITVTVQPSAGAGGHITSSHYAQPLRWQRSAMGALVMSPDPDDLVSRAATLIVALARQRDANAVDWNLSIESDLQLSDGRKLGLGSSAAVTVAVVRALGRWYRLALSDETVFRLAYLTVLSVSAHASGGDVAASTLGGWVLYRSPDRDALRQLVTQRGSLAAIDAEWPGLELERLPTPASVQLAVGWTGEPVSTEAMVRARRTQDDARVQLCAASRSAVTALTEGVRTDDTSKTMRAFARSRDALLQFDQLTGGGIETPALAQLRTIAEVNGAIAKPSGAGGGDCGVALAEQHADLNRMVSQWEAAGILSLSLDVYQREVPA